jgi:hypothetical protein
VSGIEEKLRMFKKVMAISGKNLKKARERREAGVELSSREPA